MKIIVNLLVLTTGGALFNSIVCSGSALLPTASLSLHTAAQRGVFFLCLHAQFYSQQKNQAWACTFPVIWRFHKHTHKTKRDLDGGRGSPQLYWCCNAGEWQHVTVGRKKSTPITLEQSGWHSAASVNTYRIVSQDPPSLLICNIYKINMTTLRNVFLITFYRKL